MAGPPIKFRCFRCNQLLGVARSRAGKTVNCPKCAAGLIVPEPDEAPGAGAGSPSQATAPGTVPAFLSGLAAGAIPDDLADIRPEDIRVEPDDAWEPLPINLDTPAPAAPAAAAPAPSPAPSPATEPDPIPFLTAMGMATEQRRPPPYDLGSAPTPPIANAAPGTAPRTMPLSVPAPATVEPGVPPIKIEEPSLIAERPAQGRTRDVVLPRSAVAFWSLFVLMAQALAFLAGLLAGHFIWRVH